MKHWNSDPTCLSLDVDESNPCQSALFEREICNSDLCPVYTEWSDWSQCSVTCGGGSQERFRTCVNLETRSNLICEGASQETRKCHTNTCPEWTEWSSWTPCSLTCGGGTKSRERQCQDQEGNEVYGGCPGRGEETMKCNSERCPELGPWSEWSQCTLTCGGGSRERTRECGLTSRNGGDNPCKAPLRQSEDCNSDPCPVFTQWSDWSQCSRTCGTGQRERNRKCVAFSQASSRLYCQGLLQEIDKCNTNECPAWTEWGPWTVCSVSCGGGQKKRRRHCLLPDGTSNTDLQCPGPETETEGCNDGPEEKCPEVGPWSEWSQCSLTCGSGKRKRNRECGVTPDRALSLYQHNNPCKKPLLEDEICNSQSCPVLTEWSDWTQVGATSLTQFLCSLLIHYVFNGQ